MKSRLIVILLSSFCLLNVLAYNTKTTSPEEAMKDRIDDFLKGFLLGQEKKDRKSK